MDNEREHETRETAEKGLGREIYEWMQAVVGSVLIVGISLNLLGVTKLKVMNYVPAIFLPILLCSFM